MAYACVSGRQFRVHRCLASRPFLWRTPCSLCRTDEFGASPSRVRLSLAQVTLALPQCDGQWQENGRSERLGAVQFFLCVHLRSLFCVSGKRSPCCRRIMRRSGSDPVCLDSLTSMYNPSFGARSPGSNCVLSPMCSPPFAGSRNDDSLPSCFQFYRCCLGCVDSARVMRRSVRASGWTMAEVAELKGVSDN